MQAGALVSADEEHSFAVEQRTDVEVTRSALDWVVLRPSLLTDEPGTGRVALGPAQLHGSIARSDVADVVVALLREPRIRRRILELDGEGPGMLVADAVAASVEPQHHRCRSIGADRSARIRLRVGGIGEDGGMRYTFDADLYRWTARRELWTFVDVPARIGAEIHEVADGLAGGFGAVRVDARIGTTAFRTSIFPGAGGIYALPIKRAVREAEGLELERTVHATIELVDL